MKFSQLGLCSGCWILLQIAIPVFSPQVRLFLPFPAVGSLLVVLTCSSAAVRFAENPLMRWRWIFLFALAGAVNTFYLFVMPMLITARSSEALSGMGLTVIRLLVHPLIWAVVLFFFRTFMRHIGEMNLDRVQCVKHLHHECVQQA